MTNLVKNYKAETKCPRCRRCDWCAKSETLDIETGKRIPGYQCMYPLNGASLDETCLYCGGNTEDTENEEDI